MKEHLPRQSKRSKKNHKNNKNVSATWIIIIFITTIFISGALTLISGALLSRANLISAFAVLLLIVLIGIIFDIIGVAVTAADDKPFHSMAAHKVPEAPEALKMLRQADKVSSFCNDVIGDICGVVSGTASASIAALVLAGYGNAPKGLSVLLAALVSGLTVGGKALGKSVALSQSTSIVRMAAKVVFYVKYAPSLLWEKLSRRDNDRDQRQN